jgi:hypothetical protein
MHTHNQKTLLKVKMEGVPDPNSLMLRKVTRAGLSSQICVEKKVYAYNRGRRAKRMKALLDRLLGLVLHKELLATLKSNHDCDTKRGFFIGGRILSRNSKKNGSAVQLLKREFLPLESRMGDGVQCRKVLAVALINKIEAKTLHRR